METYCKWCTANLGDVSDGDHSITYGLCSDCSKRITSTGVLLKEYIDLFNAPILVLNGEGLMCSANDMALKTLGTDLPTITGQPPGMAWECVHAREPEGCGNTVHCQSCAIRIALNDTMETGKSHLKVPAYPDVMLKEKVKKVEFLISTEKVADVVLLRIDGLRSVC